MKNLLALVLLCVLAGSARAQTAVPSAGGAAPQNPLPLTLQSTANFAVAFKNVPYSEAVTASGGTAPYTVTLSGTLPSGIVAAGSCVNISGSCAYNGTPITSGTSALSFTATDSSSPAQVATLQVNILVDTLASAVITPSGQSIAISQTLQMKLTPTWTTFGSPASGPGSDITPLVTWSCTGTGCASVSSAGVFTASASGGTPTVNVAAFDGVTPTGVTVTVVNSTVVITNSATLPEGQINQAYPDTATGSLGLGSGAQMMATGGTPGGACALGYTWALVAGAFPAGVTMSSCGIISGTATASGTFSPQIKATDNAANSSSTITFTLVIAAVSSIAVTPGTPSISVGAQQQMKATATYTGNGTTADVTVGTAGGAVSWTNGPTCNSGNTLTNVTTNTCTLNSVPAGSIVVCGLDDVNGGGSTETLTSVKDQSANTYTITPHSPTTYTAGIGMNWVAYFLSALTGTNTITGTWGTSTFNHLGCQSFLPSGGTAAFDTDLTPVTNAASNTVVSSPSITPAGAGELLFNSTNTAGTITSANSPWLLASGATFAGGVANEYILNSGSGAQSANYTQQAGAYSGISAAFSITAAAGSGTVWTATDIAPGHNVASVTASGLATCISGGTSTIKAAIGGVNGTATLTCNSVATDTALIISPSSSSPANLGSTTYKVTGNVTGNDLTSSSTFASDNVNVVSLNGAGPGNNIGTCKVSNGASANVSASNPLNGGIASGKSAQTCISLSSADLLAGCIVTGTNEASSASVSGCLNAFVPAGWTFVKAQGFENGLASGEFSSGGSIVTTRSHTPTHSWGALFNGDGFTDRWGFSPNASTDILASTWTFWDTNAHIEVGNAFLFRLGCAACTILGHKQEFLVNFDNFGNQVSISTAAQGLTLDFSPQGDYTPPQFATKGYTIPGGTWEQETFWFHPNTCTAGVANADGFARVYINGTLFIDSGNRNVIGCITGLSALTLEVGGQTDSECVENSSNQCVGPAGTPIPAGGHQQRCTPTYATCPALEANGVTPCVQQNSWNRYHDDTVILKK